MGYVVYSRIRNMVCHFWLVLFSFSSGVYLLFLSKVVMVTFIFSGIFLFSPCCLPSFLDHVCTWRVGVRIALSVLDSFFFCVGLAEIIWSSKRYLGQQHRSHNRKNTLFSEHFCLNVFRN